MNVRFFDVVKNISYPVSGPMVLEPKLGARVEISETEYEVTDTRYVLQKDGGDWELVVKIRKPQLQLFALFSQDLQFKLAGILVGITYMVLLLVYVLWQSAPDAVTAFIGWHVRGFITVVLVIGLPMLGAGLVKPDARPSERSFLSTYIGTIFFTSVAFVPFIWWHVSAPDTPMVTNEDAMAYLDSLFSQSKGIAFGLLGWASFCAAILKLFGFLIAAERIKTLGELPSSRDKK